MKVGFIGLGNMGAPMAANLAVAGHDVVGFDLIAPCSDGVGAASSAADAARGRDVVVTMLPDGAILRAVAAEIIAVMDQGAVFLDCSTVDVESARAVAGDATGAGLLALDAPVSGGVGGAIAGTLTFMAGGSDAGFAKVVALFDIMGSKAVHCGASGNGQAAKICNNMILGATMIVTCEAFALADKLGLERQKMFDVVSTSSGYSWTMNAYCPDFARRQRLRARIFQRSDAQRPASISEGGSRRERRHPPGPGRNRAVREICRARRRARSRFFRHAAAI